MAKRIIIIGAASLIVVWGLAYYYGGVDAHFLSGWLKSQRSTNTTPQIIISNTNTTNATVPTTNTTPPATNTTPVFSNFSQDVVAHGLTKPTRLAFEPDTGDLLVSQLDGHVYRITAFDTKGKSGAMTEVASGFNQLLGISVVAGEVGATDSVPPGVVTSPQKLLVASRNTVSLLSKGSDGRYAGRTDVLKNLPAGRHQTDLALLGPDGYLYVANGSRSDRGETAIDSHEASILRSDISGNNLKVFASGLRNPFSMSFYQGKLYVADNGRDVPATGVPDELNLVTQGGKYGWPGCYGDAKGSNCSGTTGPLALLQERSSADGFAFYDGITFPDAYRGNVFMALFGANSKDPSVGKRVVRLVPTESRHWKVEDFVTGLGNPIDVKVGPKDGDVYILDYGRGNIVRVHANFSS